MLIGEPGVGKTAIVDGFAQRIVEGGVPDSLRDKRLVTLDLSAMAAGAKYRGEFVHVAKCICCASIMRRADPVPPKRA